MSLESLIREKLEGIIKSDPTDRGGTGGKRKDKDKDKDKDKEKEKDEHPVFHLSPTLASTLACPALPYPTLPYPTLPYPTLPYPTLPYPTLPSPAIPFPLVLVIISQLFVFVLLSYDIIQEIASKSRSFSLPSTRTPAPPTSASTSVIPPSTSPKSRTRKAASANKVLSMVSSMLNTTDPYDVISQLQAELAQKEGILIPLSFSPSSLCFFDLLFFLLIENLMKY